jgi:hypothetical protein
MKIKVERSGGFAGIPSSCEMNTNKLPLSLEDKFKQLLRKKQLPLAKVLKRPKGAADYLNYKITIIDGKKEHVIKGNEFELDADVKALIDYIQKNSMQKIDKKDEQITGL